MGKGRFTALDVTAMTASLQNLIIGTRVANIYDLNNRTYLIKFSGKDKRLFLIIESGIRFHCTSFMREKQSMPNHFASKLRKYLKSKKLSEIKQFGRDRIVMLTFGVQETHKFYLIIELFAGGNIILCDYEYNIIISLRVHHDTKSNINIKPGEKYPISNIMKKKKKIDDKQEIEKNLRNCIARLIKKNYDNKNNNNNNKKLSNRQKRKQRMNQKMETIYDFIMKTMSTSPIITKSIMNKFKINKNESLLNYVMRPYPLLKPVVIHNNDDNDNDNDESSDDTDDDDEQHEDDMYYDMNEEEKINAMRLNNDKFNILMNCFIDYEKLIESLENNECNGHIISKKISLSPMKKINIFVKKPRKKQVKPVIDLENNEEELEEEQEAKKDKKKEKEEEKEEIKFVYDEFIPFKPCSDCNCDRIDSFNTFNECVDEFYSSSEAIKNEQKQTRAESLAFKKLESAKKQHENRINQLQFEADHKSFYASIVEENLDLVDKSINGINTLLSQGIDWNDLGNRIREETQFGNPIASIITSLKLHQNIITLKLKHEIQIKKIEKVKEEDDIDNDNDDDADDDESDIDDMFDDNDDDDDDDRDIIQTKIEYHKIDIDIGLSAWNNARRYYLMRKQLLDKKDKTMDATNKAIKAAENKTKLSLKEASKTAQIEKLRKIYWFEKFFWFISSDNFLVIAGRDAQQNEIIVKKYMDKKRDIYVHALIHGASSVIIKNPSGLKQLPPRTINEAGSMCVCRSKAWNNNISTEAYWVYGYQVSKTPQSGQYLPTGSFVIRGKRNFIQQQQLQMGMALLFRIDEKSQKLYHTNIRQINYFNNNDDDDNNKNNKNNKKYGDVTQQFILNDIDDDNDDNDNIKSMKKPIKNEENAIFITKTMIQSSIKKKKEFEEERRIKKLKEKEIDKNDNIDNNDDNNNDNNNDNKTKSKKSKTDKKLAKYGFDNKNKMGSNKKLSKREKNKRKKKGKYNRLYDEEDRKLVQKLLGVKPEHLKKTKSDNDDNNNNNDKNNDDELKKNEPKEGYELNANPMNLNRNQQQEKKQDINNDEEEEEKEEKEEDEYDKQRKFALANRLEDELKLLTGKLNENDIILYCMVMCAPYNCLNKDEYEYKIKIQPGTNKRGKAVKFVSEIFENMVKSSPLNDKLNLLSLCKAIKETEINHIFLSNVKISAPGIKSLQIQQKQLQKKKQREKWKLQQKQQQLQQSKNKGYNPSTNPKKRKKRK